MEKAIPANPLAEMKVRVKRQNTKVEDVLLGKVFFPLIHNILSLVYFLYIVEEFRRFFSENWPNWRTEMIYTGFDYDQKKLWEIEGTLSD